MSFDVFLMAFRDGQPAAGDSAAAQAVLDRYPHRAKDGCYVIRFDDQTELEFFGGSGLEPGEKHAAGGMLALRGFGTGIADFISEFLAAAGCVALPAVEPACVLLPRADLAPHLPADMRAGFQQILVANGAEVAAALRGGLAGWQAYRDQMCGGGAAPGS
jgi:hypothetical protein